MPRKFWEHLCAIINNNVNPEMTKNSWDEWFGCHGRFLMNQFCSDISDDKITSDIYDVVEKKEIYSICLHNTRHKRRPASNRYFLYEPFNAIITENAPSLPCNGDGVDAAAGTIADGVDAAGDDNDDQDVNTLGTAAENEDRPPFFSIVADDNEALAIPNTSVQNNSSKSPRKKSTSFKNNTLLGAMLVKPIIVNVLPEPIKKILLLGTVSVKKSEKEAKAMLLTANIRISNLESHI